MASSAVLDVLDKAVVRPKRWNVTWWSLLPLAWDRATNCRLDGNLVEAAPGYPV
jgi:hypothetical protein